MQLNIFEAAPSPEPKAEPRRTTDEVDDPMDALTLMLERLACIFAIARGRTSVGMRIRAARAREDNPFAHANKLEHVDG